MKERYETPEMEIVEFETEDIITTRATARYTASKRTSWEQRKQSTRKTG